LVVVAAAALAPATLALAEDPLSPPSQPTQWTEYEAADRGFAVAFPSAPESSSLAVTGLNPLVQYSFRANEGGDTAYSVVVLEYPKDKAPKPPHDELYSRMVSAYAKESQSAVRKKGPATIAAHDGFEAITDDGKEKINHLVDIVASGDRIYMLISAGPKGHATSDDAERFRDSFRLTGEASQSAASPSPTTP
jgi:hypothetical protein